jgi:hypothetical protein
MAQGKAEGRNPGLDVETTPTLKGSNTAGSFDPFRVGFTSGA